MPKVRHVTSWMLHHPDDLDDEQQFQLKQVRTTCVACAATTKRSSMAYVAAQLGPQRSVLKRGRFGDGVARWQLRSRLTARITTQWWSPRLVVVNFRFETRMVAAQPTRLIRIGSRRM